MRQNTQKEDLLFASIGLAILAVCLWDGIGVTFDSHLYLLGSAYIQENGFAGIFTVPALRTKPPVLSVIYAVLQNNLWLIKTAHIAFLAGTLLVNFKLATILIPAAFFRRFAKGLLATATPFMLVHSFLWSEPAFIFILSLYFMLSYRALTKNQTGRSLYLLPILGILLAGLRHIGVVFALTGSLYLLLHCSKFTRQQLVPVLLNVLLPPLALFAWHSAVLAHGGNAEEYNITKGLDVVRNFLVYADVLKVWLLPPGLPFPELLSVLAFIVYAGAALAAIKLSYTSEVKHLVILFVLSAAVYAGVMLLKGDLLIDDNERYLAVIYAPLTLLLVFVISRWAAAKKINLKWLYVLLLLWCCYPLVRTVHNVNRWAHNGIQHYDPATVPPLIQQEYKNPG